MSLADLDAFLAHARGIPELNRRLHDHQQPLDLPAFLEVARGEGFALSADDILAAQQREEERLSEGELQERAGVEARRLRHFIPG
jgi:predicted ribosomally synthesized peptide with nif11-like leader